MRLTTLAWCLPGLLVLAEVILLIASPSLAAFELGKPKLVWSDEFNGPAGSLPDPSKWSLVTGGGGWGNDELETYTNRRENVQQRNGNLVITALDDTRQNYTSGRLQTKGHFAQTYGLFEARMKLPAGKGIWPAFWLLADNVDTVHWPACGEIDILETIGDPHVMYSTLHGPGYSGANALSTKFPLPVNDAIDDQFHIYSVDWTPDRIRFYFDNHLIVERTPKNLPASAQWVFNHPFFILFDLAVGGKWPGNPDGQTSFPKRMLVDYVRVYGAPASAR